MRSQSIYRRSISTNSKSAEGNREFYIAAIESQLCVSICAFNEQTCEVYITQYLDCSTFRITSSTILRFTPKVLVSLQGNEKSVFFKQLEDDLGDTQIYFLPQSILNQKLDLTKYANFAIKLLQLQTCLQCLIYAVSQQLSVQIPRLPIQFYNLKDIMVMSKQATLSLELAELQKAFKPVTSGGTRLLKANLTQPFSVLDQILPRQNLVKQLLKLSDQSLSALKVQLNKFKTFDSLASQQQKNTKIVQEQLLQIFRLYSSLKDIGSFAQFLQSVNLTDVLGLRVNSIIQSEDFIFSKQEIEKSIDTTLSQSQQLSDDILYFILRDESDDILQSRDTYLKTQKEINSLYQKYLQSFCIQIKCKKIKNNKYSIQCLRNGYVLELSQQEANRNNINEQDIKRLIEREEDSVNFIDKNQQKITILTDKLAGLNIKLDQSISLILSITSQSISSLYETLQSKCSWIFQMNSFINQLDLLLAFRDFYSQQNSTQVAFPVFSDYFSIQKAKGLKGSLIDNFQASFAGFNVVYDSKENLSEQLKLIGQYVILAQIGCPLPCHKHQQPLFSSLFTHFQKHTLQSLQERQSSFTSEIHSFNSILQADLADGLVLCDSMVLSSSYETNIAFNLSYLKLISKKCFHGVFGSVEPDMMQISEIAQCTQLLSTQHGIQSVNPNDLDELLDNAFNHDYKQGVLQKLHGDLRFPAEFCQIMQRNFVDC